eukprot:343748_1
MYMLQYYAADTIFSSKERIGSAIKTTLTAPFTRIHNLRKNKDIISQDEALPDYVTDQNIYFSSYTRIKKMISDEGVMSVFRGNQSRVLKHSILSVLSSVMADFVPNLENIDALKSQELLKLLISLTSTIFRDEVVNFFIYPIQTLESVYSTDLNGVYASGEQTVQFTPSRLYAGYACHLLGNLLWKGKLIVYNGSRNNSSANQLVAAMCGCSSIYFEAISRRQMINNESYVDAQQKYEQSWKRYSVWTGVADACPILGDWVIETVINASVNWTLDLSMMQDILKGTSEYASSLAVAFKF